VTADLVPIAPPGEHPHAVRAYAVPHKGQIIGTVALVRVQRPKGTGIRRDWWAAAILPTPRRLPRPFDTCANAAAALRFQYDRLTTPPPPPPPDPTLEAILTARDSAGTSAALWLAASITVHHITELDANRQVNPPALWRELHRITAWLEAATAGAAPPPGNASRVVHYRRSRTWPVGRSPSSRVAAVDTEFSAALWEWRGPAPFFWLSVPEPCCAQIRAEAAEASYGWGAIPVLVRVGATEWETSLLPKDGGYALPVKAAVRTRERIGEGDVVTVAMSIAPRGGRAANGTGPTC
jgi:hypothetical protein